MADAKSTSKSTSSTPKNVIQAPTRNAARATEEVPVDTTQEYDSSTESKGLGEEGIKKPGDPVVRSTRHQARVDDES